ncbi:DMT family transporter [Frigidibacter sp. RF13]|uniref:DMT family transporter n=1 Tax=Frigidibacter sp. RF13 TaxID=2997340 RepID=UPI0022702CE7|nr:DMT family transporter [Frigidibacter sp. RF13]MCY1127328.1 DMT family transporter [Frigidibacter sp. RF13]
MTIAERQAPLAGILWMVLSGLSFVAVNGTVHHLGTALPSAESAFIRFLYGLVFLAVPLWRVLRAGLPKGALRMIALRGGLHTVAVILWFYAMARIPIADVTAIGYLSPIVVTAGAALLLGEPIAARRIMAIAVALVGALIVLRPGLRELAPGHLAQVGAATFFGLSYIVAKRLSAVLPAGALVALLSVSVALGLAPFALWAWVTPTLAQLAALAVVALFATLGHYFMARAFAVAPVSVTQPVIFLQLVWATLLGFFAFGERVDPYVLLGGAIIIGAISYMSWREAQIARAGVTPPAGAERV